MVEETYNFTESPQEKKSALSGIGRFIWNSDTKEFLGRDGASWGKVSLFYAVFYLCLGSFFVGMLAVFVAIMPRDRPTYVGESSTMNARGLNPGLGFRPQVDVEDSLIYYNPKVRDSTENHGFQSFVTNLKNFLYSKYESGQEDSDSYINCFNSGKGSSEFDFGKSCRFEPEKIFAATSCIESRYYGYNSTLPCVLVKVNKIIEWVPSNPVIKINCTGETAIDKDNLKKVYYHSEGKTFDEQYGYIDGKHFPFKGQKTYRAPFIWVQFDVTPNVLVNIECKAWADNIDNDDRLNRRGQTKFSLLIEQPK